MNKIKKTIRRRRKEGKTDYRARMEILKTDFPRLVVRKTNKYLLAQIVVADIAQDKVIVGVSSKDLLSEGWPKENSGALKSIGASYLTGLILAKKFGKKKKCISDIGLQRNVARGRIYALIKGAIDGGIEIPHSKESLPSEEQITKNAKTKEIVNKLREKLI